MIDMFNSYKNIQISEPIKIREILQQAALLGLYRAKFFDEAAFYGGTALRILYGMNRFSEDLDFSLLTPNPSFNFAPFLHSLEKEMLSMGFQVSIIEKEKDQYTGILSAFLKTNTLGMLLSMQPQNRISGIHPEQKIKIKIEIDVEPPPGFRTASVLVHEPAPFHVRTFHLSDLFAGKMHACIWRAWKQRVKGRDWFDFIWFIQKKIPLHFAHFKRIMAHVAQAQETINTPEDFQTILREKIQSINWELAKKDVESFIVDPKSIEIWSAQFFLELAEHLQLE